MSTSNLGTHRCDLVCVCACVLCCATATTFTFVRCELFIYPGAYSVKWQYGVADDLHDEDLLQLSGHEGIHQNEMWLISFFSLRPGWLRTHQQHLKQMLRSSHLCREGRTHGRRVVRETPMGRDFYLGAFSFYNASNLELSVAIVDRDSLIWFSFLNVSRTLTL